MSEEQNFCSTETYDVSEYRGQRDLDPNHVDCFLMSRSQTEKHIASKGHDKLLCQICKLSFEGSHSSHRLLEHINSIHGFNIFEKGNTCVCDSIFQTPKGFQSHRNLCLKHAALIVSHSIDEINAEKRETIVTNSDNTESIVAYDSIDDIRFKNEQKADDKSFDHSIDLEPEKDNSKVVNNDSLKCYICSEAFQSVREFTSHVITCHKNELSTEDFDDLFYRCRKCCVTYPNLVSLRGHFFKKHTALVIYRCVVCHITFRAKKSLRIHYNNFHASKSRELHTCDECGKELANLKAKKAHMRLKHGPHIKKQGFRCRLCQEKFDTKEKRKLHYEAEHLGESPFMCTDCGKGFSSKSGLYGHRQLHKTDQPSTCPYCEKIFNRRDSYYEHILIHVGPRHRCPHCPKEFVQRSNLVRHIRIHTGQKPYACTFCDKRFSDKGACNSHIRVHTKEEQCACPYCGQTFTKKQKLKYHIRKHTGEGLISCEICSKTFTNAFALKEHRAIHDRQTQTICVECGKAFNSAKYLQRHVALVHQEPQVSSVTLHCPICGKTFHHQTRLKSHLVTHLGKKHLQCLICEKRYSSTKSVRNHLKQSHDLKADQHEFKKSVRSTLENTPITKNSVQFGENLNSPVNGRNTVVTFLFREETSAVVESKNAFGQEIVNESNDIELTNKFYDRMSISRPVENKDRNREHIVIDQKSFKEVSYKDSMELNKSEKPRNEETHVENLKVCSEILKSDCSRGKTDRKDLSEALFNVAGRDVGKKLSNLDEGLSINQAPSFGQLKSDSSAIIKDRDVQVSNDAPKEREIVPIFNVAENNLKTTPDSGKDISRRRKQLRTPKKWVSPIAETLDKVDNKLKSVIPKRDRVEAIARSLKESSNINEAFD